jgi:replicative DNA helicase
LAANIAKITDKPILFFSLEMSKQQLIYRFLSTESGINSNLLRSGRFLNEDWINLNTAIENLLTLKIYFDDNPSLSITNLRAKIKKFILEQKQLGLVIIDYLQLMQYSNLKTENRTQELAQITRSLKNIAREFQVPVIALSQLSRNVENRVNKRPILSDLRESGSIEQDADVVLMLYRESYYNSIVGKNENITPAELIIAKHRNGPMGVIELSFQNDPTKFVNTFSNI